jgi:hypothetical protein
VDEVDKALFAAATRVMMHNGKTTKFWQSSWLDGPATMFPTLYSHSKRKNRTVANAMENNNWTTDLMHNLSSSIVTEYTLLRSRKKTEYTLLWELVEAAGFNGEDQTEDEIIWTRKRDGTYSAKSAYAVQFDGSLMTTFPALVWKIWAPSKCKFFMWLLLQCRV